MPRKLPSLSAAKAFEAAARLLSFRAAAEELSVTHSAISHQVKSLEAQLGVLLFKRGPQSVSLTEAGRLYFPVLRDALDRIAEGTELVRAMESPKELTVQVYITMAMNWLIPRLHEFQQRFPDIKVRLETSRVSWDFDAEHADLGIVLQTPSDPSVHREVLARAAVTPLCSPKLLGGKNGISRPEDLHRFPLLKIYTAAQDWPIWFEKAGVAPAVESEAITVDSYILAYEAAMDGQGVAMGLKPFAMPDLNVERRLVAPFGIVAERSDSWLLVCRPERLDRPAVRAFRNWIREAAGAAPAKVA
ncbi:LysR substrate-binding domain-containing protein [Hwanghaeella sp.]|uniref:LysR substrate-binding domain-containing protein n=1 Tax=Hwanghaeella sp. TaxID=2605943 RepID=UPI003CCC12EF